MTPENSDQRRERGTSTRGFASMDQARQREIASKGGKAAHQKGTAHQFSSEEAREAGRKAHAKGTAHEFTSEEAREAGRKGGRSGSRRQADARAEPGERPAPGGG